MTYDKQYAQEVLGAKCDECPLRVGGKFVPSDGPEDAEIAFVGEAPGLQEVRGGKPFVGPSGKLLDIVNAKHGIEREKVFLTNATLCRPADNGPPPKAAIAACRPRLLAELGRRERTVVALGNSAALGVLGVEGVTKLRVGPGKTSPYDALEGSRIIPTVHPAACLRQSDMFPSLVADIGKVGINNEPWTEPRYEVADDPVDAIKHLRELERRGGDLVVDIEVDIDKGTSFDHPNRYGILCVGLAWEKGRSLVIGERACQDDNVRDAMADAFAACRLVAQNGKFDLAGLNPVLGSLQLHFDTMLASYCFDERPGVHALEHQGVEHLGTPNWKAEIDRDMANPDPDLVNYYGYGRIRRKVLYKYNAFDASVTWDLKEYYEAKFAKAPELRMLHDFLVEASNELMFLELNGLAVDREYIKELTEKYVESLGVIEKELGDILVSPEVGYNPINPRSPKQVAEALAHMGCRVGSTNEETLKKIMDTLVARSQEHKPLYQFCEVLLKHRRETKMFGTYVKGTAKRLYRGRVYPTFLLHGSTTGRLACRNPNLQNVPRESAIKALFVPGKEGNVFVQADYAQAELRILTWLARDEYFRAILNDPTRDLFDELTPILYPNLPPKQLMSESAWKEIRIRVKSFVYGLGYGRTEFSIASEYKIDVKEAVVVKNRFFDVIPAVVDWQRQIQKEVWEGRDLITPFGRHRRFHLITEENWKSVKNEAMAFKPQSTSSDVCLRAMVRVRRDLRGSGAFVRNIVHDSILVDTPADMASDVSVLLDRHMVDSATELVGDYVAFKTDCKIGNNWGEV